MTTIATIDHVTAALARLPQQFRDKTNVRALVTALVSSKQSLEQALIDLLTKRYLDTAEGIQLDAIGKLVGQPRNGLSDDDYRRYIRVRIRVNRSSGTAPDILRIAKLTLSDSTLKVIVDNQGVAAYVVRIALGTVEASLADILITFLGQATAKGVRIILETMPVGPAAGFRFDGDGPGGLGFGQTASVQLNTAHITTLVGSRDGASGEGYTLDFVADGAGTGSLVEGPTGAVFHFQSGVTTSTNFESSLATSTHLYVKAAGLAATLIDPTDVLSTSLSGYIAGGVLSGARSS